MEDIRLIEYIQTALIAPLWVAIAVLQRDITNIRDDVQQSLVQVAELRGICTNERPK